MTMYAKRKYHAVFQGIRTIKQLRSTKRASLNTVITAQEAVSNFVITERKRKQSVKRIIGI